MQSSIIIRLDKITLYVAAFQDIYKDAYLIYAIDV